MRINLKYYIAFILLLFTINSFAQLDTLHYLPPLACSDNRANGDYGWQYLWLSTNETSTFTVTISNNAGFSTTVDISSTNPAQLDLGRIQFTSDIPNSNTLSNLVENNSEGVVTRGQLYRVLDDEGLVLSASKAFFVSMRHQSDLQGAMVTSKGTVGFGTRFYSGHVYSVNENGGQEQRNTQFISVMATEDNTLVNFENTHGLNNINEGRSSNQINNIRLNKGQSYVVGMQYSEMEQNGAVPNGSYTSRNQMNGTSVTSNKPISVISGSWTASSAGNNRDMGADHLVPADVVGQEYILIKGQGRTTEISDRKKDSYDLEKTIIVATEDNTTLNFNNGSPAARTIANAGDYTIIDVDEYGINDILRIESDKNVYVYQTISGAVNSSATSGMVFAPPIKCTSDKTVMISGANRLANFPGEEVLNAAIVLVTQKGSTVSINGVTVNETPWNVSGNSYWEGYKITNTALANRYQGTTNNWNFAVVSSGALNAALFVETGATGAAGYYSGFGDKPQIDGRPLISGNALCAGEMTLDIEVGSFTSYNWYRNNVFVETVTDTKYEVSEPGRYKVTGTTACDGSTTETFPSNEILVNPCLGISDVTIAEDGNTATFTVSLSHSATDDDITFDYATVDGTAIQGKDYTAKSGSGTILAGNTSTSFTVDIRDDLLEEPDETFTVQLSDAGYATIFDGTGLCTIEDDGDPRPSINVNNTYTVAENVLGGQLQVDFDLTAQSGYTITADYTVTNGTATNGQDFTLAAGSISIAPETDGTNISVAITNDNIYEPQALGYENFTINLTNLQYVNAGNISSEIRITDDETISVLSSAASSATEGNNLDFTVNLDKACSEDVTFQYRTVDVSTTIGVDYNGQATFATATIPAGSTSIVLSFLTLNEGTSEGNEELQLEIQNPTNASIASSPLVYAGTIFDDSGTPQLFITDASATEGNNVVFRVNLSIPRNSPTNFRYTTSGISATDGTDYTSQVNTLGTIPRNTTFVDISIPTIQDTDEEGTETFQVDLSNFPGSVNGLDLTAVGTILDDDETPVANTDSYTITEDPVTPLSADLTDNDLGLGDAPITVSLAIGSNVSNGILVLNIDGSFTYTPDADFNGSDGFRYRIQDVDGDVSEADVTITITPTDDTPVATDDNFGPMNESTNPAYTQLSGNVITNDTGLGDNAEVELVNTTPNGTLGLNSDGTFTYDPNAQFFGEDNFKYKLKDDDGDESANATVRITVSFYNDAAPVAVDNSYSGPENANIIMSIIDNDTDVDGKNTIDLSSVAITQNPANGSISHNRTTGQVTYTPNTNFNGSDSFKYRILDQVIDGQPSYQSNEATVSIVITNTNQNPIAVCQDYTIYLDAAGEAVLNASDLDGGSSDPDAGDVLSFLIEGNTTKTFYCGDKGINRVILTVKDQLNAQSTCEADVTVLDNIQPMVQAGTANIMEYCAVGAGGKAVNYTAPLFSDNCDGSNLSGTLVAGKPSGSVFPVGTTTVTYEFTDASGNGPISTSFTVTIREDVEADISADDVDLTICVGELITFTAGETGGTGPFTYTFYVDGVDQTIGVSGNSFAINSLSDGQKVSVKVTDANSREDTSTELTITVNPKPQTGSIYHLEND